MKMVRNKDNAKVIVDNNSRSYFSLISQPRFSQAIISSAIGYVTMSLLMTATPISMHLMDHISIGKTGFVIQMHIYWYVFTFFNHWKS